MYKNVIKNNGPQSIRLMGISKKSKLKGVLEMKIVAYKQTSIGMVEIRESGGMYMLYVGGQLSCQSYDYAFIFSEYERL